jgi:DNA (cytosine-5)-methyltransferase 1
MNHIGLFEGIGGFSAAAEMMGWTTIAWCEWNEFCQNQLKNHYPNAKGHGDIRTTDFTIYRGKCDVLTGGFPCQPYSVAGQRKGKEDDRHLWPEMLRAIREIAPRYVVGENVRGLLSWNGGMVFDEVQADLEACGYEVLPFVLPACGVNAPHRRDRVWFVAYRADAGIEGLRREGQDSIHGEQTPSDAPNERQQSPGRTRTGRAGFEDYNQPVIANPDGQRLQQHNNAGKPKRSGWADGSVIPPKDWSDFPTVSPLRNGNDGLPTELLRQRIREDSMGYLSEEEIDKILSEAGNKWAAETIKAGGNAVVPQVVLQIFKAIQQFENNQ